MCLWVDRKIAVQMTVCICMFIVVLVQHLLSMFCAKDFPSVNYSLVTKDIVCTA